ncbi:MAG: hypothetical protein ABI640_04080 [Gammaproteobacteria bacterium]
MIPQRKHPSAPRASALDFDTTQEIDPKLVDAILTGGNNATLTQSDFDDTEILLDVGALAKPAAPRR